MSATKIPTRLRLNEILVTVGIIEPEARMGGGGERGVNVWWASALRSWMVVMVVQHHEYIEYHWTVQLKRLTCYILVCIWVQKIKKDGEKNRMRFLLQFLVFFQPHYGMTTTKQEGLLTSLWVASYSAALVHWLWTVSDPRAPVNFSFTIRAVVRLLPTMSESWPCTVWPFSKIVPSLNSLPEPCKT